MDNIKQIIKKLTPFQRQVLFVMSVALEKNYILEVFDIHEVKTTYTLTNGEDDYDDIRESTMKKIKSLDFISHKRLPSSDTIIRTKWYIRERYLAEVYVNCLK